MGVKLSIRSRERRLSPRRRTHSTGPL
jgi:hypothetical protein